MVSLRPVRLPSSLGLLSNNLIAAYISNSTTKTIRYGPFPVPDMMTNNGMEDYLILSAETPCQDCFITFIEAGLEYPNGSYANANTSLWLHHTVLYNLNRTDSVCVVDGGGNPQPERWFASGNERTAFDLSMNGYVLTLLLPHIFKAPVLFCDEIMFE
jgi:hypothetical protein